MSSFVLAFQKKREKNSIFSRKFKSDTLTFLDRSMLEALGSPGERSILSEKKRRTGSGDRVEGKPASFLEEGSQAGGSSQEKAEQKVEESREADKRSEGEEDREKRVDLEEVSKEIKKGLLTLSNC